MYIIHCNTIILVSLQSRFPLYIWQSHQIQLIVNNIIATSTSNIKCLPPPLPCGIKMFVPHGTNKLFALQGETKCNTLTDWQTKHSLSSFYRCADFGPRWWHYLPRGLTTYFQVSGSPRFVLQEEPFWLIWQVIVNIKGSGMNFPGKRGRFWRIWTILAIFINSSEVQTIAKMQR